MMVEHEKWASMTSVKRKSNLEFSSLEKRFRYNGYLAKGVTEPPESDLQSLNFGVGPCQAGLQPYTKHRFPRKFTFSKGIKKLM